LRFVLGQFDARDADLVEAELDGDRIEPLAQSREIRFRVRTCHAGTGGGVRQYNRAHGRAARRGLFGRFRATRWTASPSTGRHPGYTLMQRAGGAAFDGAAPLAGCRPHRRACGAGNNAGDGYVFARTRARGRRRPFVGALGDPARLAGDCGTGLSRIRGGSAARRRATSGRRRADLVVDALLGTGVTGRSRAHCATASSA
jgi:hypothetical protein